MSALFPDASGKPGYDKAEVDEFLARAKAAYEDVDGEITSSDIRQKVFTTTPKDGYDTKAVDDALWRLEEAFASRERAGVTEETGEAGYYKRIRAQAQEILDRGMRKRGSYDLLGARADFDRLVAYCPEYAEGYNQRAFINFMRNDYEPAIIDLTRALELSPTHTGALTGRALSYYALGRTAEARADLEVALGLNPWLPERHMLSDPAMKTPQQPKGDDL